MILKRYRFVVECTFDIEDLTSEVVHRSLKPHLDYEDEIKDRETWERADRQRRLLHALLQNKEVLEKYVQDDIAGQIETLVYDEISPQLNSGEDSDDMLLRVIENMEPEEAATLKETLENDESSTDLLIECFKLKLDRTTISEITEVHE